MNKDENKVALITGGARRLGRRISYFFADEGYSVAVIYNSSIWIELEKTRNYFKNRNTDYLFLKCDLKDLKQLKRAVKDTAEHFGKIDVLVNNAGLFSKVDFTDISEKHFDETIAVNLKAPLFLSQYAFKYLLKSEKPQIINISSLGGLMNWSNFLSYSISKTGMIKLTELLAKRLAPDVRVNSIAPGTLFIQDEEANSQAKINVKNIPLNRYGSPDEIIEAIRFLLKCEYVTGETIVIDGGRKLN